MEKEQVDKISRNIDSLAWYLFFKNLFIYIIIGGIVINIYFIQNPQLEIKSGYGRFIAAMIWPVYISDITSTIYKEWRESLFLYKERK